MREANAIESTMQFANLMIKVEPLFTTFIYLISAIKIKKKTFYNFI